MSIGNLFSTLNLQEIKTAEELLANLHTIQNSPKGDDISSTAVAMIFGNTSTVGK